jgi:hypothetical protein
MSGVGTYFWNNNLSWNISQPILKIIKPTDTRTQLIMIRRVVLEQRLADYIIIYRLVFGVQNGVPRKLELFLFQNSQRIYFSANSSHEFIQSAFVVITDNKAGLSTYWAPGLKFYMSLFDKTCFIKLFVTLAE